MIRKNTGYFSVHYFNQQINLVIVFILERAEKASE